MERCGSPSEAHARIEIAVIRLIQSGIFRTWWGVYGYRERSVERARSKASPVELILVEDRRTVVRDIGNSVVVPTNAEVGSEGRRHFPFVLKVRHIHSAAKLMAAPGGDETQFRDRGRY